MASREGARPVGTDGSDFSHREKVASQYTESVKIKQKLRFSLIPHMFMTFLLFAKMVVVRMGNTYFLPPRPWELIWLLSGVCAYVGYGAMSKNSRLQLMIYMIGNVVAGFCPLVLGGLEGVMKMRVDFQEMKPPPTWKNAPAKFALIVFCCQIQIMGLYHASRLLKIWKQKKRN